ncbi:hypothetical protein [Novacetimonas pomaceti]|uniref:Uncharacterized protein n=1 Tax=Novacetimonas pomaceti TaxID=2021998 RepID=A0A318QFW1_9PROT|nr:hypothetical protein [Novacetimonas pomaceti]PYD76351.1 hypothetical protein CFR71_05850 [Novacetimonas pomaceti]
MHGRSPLTVRRLGAADILVLYPLIQHAFPEMERRRWMDVGRRMSARRKRPRQGILVAHYGTRGLPCAMVTYRRDFDIRLGQVLTSDHYIVMTPGDAQHVMNAFHPVMAELARELGCHAIRTMQPVTKMTTHPQKVCPDEHIVERTLLLTEINGFSPPS